jgi:hypothetical protein
MKIFRYILPGVLIFLCLFCSCSMGGADPEENITEEEEGTGEEAENPDDKSDIPEEVPPELVFLSCKAVSEREIIFEFSQPVTVVFLNFSPELEIEKIEEGSTVKVKLAESPEPGQLFEADFLVKDENGNTINEQVSFRSRNNRVPALQINELRTEYSKPKAEFIDFKMLSDGNLGALRVFVVSNSKNPLIYEFDPIEVKEDEYVVLHLRTLEDSCKNEYGERLDESGGNDSSSTARDFWIPGSEKLLRKTDVVYVTDQDNQVLDAVMIAEVSASSWDKAYLSEAAEFLFKQGAWKSSVGTICSPADAVDSSGIKTSTTKSISRDETAENTHTAADWYIADGVSPGLSNKP